MSDEPTTPEVHVEADALTTGDRMELYKVTVEMADRVSARRGVANSFFLTLHTALIASLALLNKGSVDTVDRLGGLIIQSEHVQPIDSFYVKIVAVAGMLLAFAWWMLLQSYRNLNRKKFQVIHRLEANWSVKPYADEWESTSPATKRRRFPIRELELGTVERLVPVAFGALYVVVFGNAV